MTNDPARIRNLSDVARAVTLVLAAPVPDLIVEQYDTSRLSQVVGHAVFPLRSRHLVRGFGT